MRGRHWAWVIGMAAMGGCATPAPIESRQDAPVAVTAPVSRAPFVVLVETGGTDNPAAVDTSGNLILRVPPHLEKYGQQFSRLMVAGTELQEALRQVTKAMEADGISAQDALKQIAQMNPELTGLARLFGFTIPGLGG